MVYASRVFSRGRVIVALVVLLFGSVLALAVGVQSPAGAVTQPDDTYLRLATNTNGGGDSEQGYSRSEAVALAKRFDFAVGLRWTFEDHIGAMESANPQFRMLTYMNGAFARSKDAPSMPDAWFLRDSSGNKVKSVYWGNFLMDPANPGWQAWTAAKCEEWNRLSGFHGCMLDDMGAGNLTSGNLTARPIDPRTGKLMDTYDWIGYTADLARAVGKANPGLLIGANGLNNGSKFFGNNVVSKRLLAAVDVGMAEGWLRNEYASPSTFRSESAWRAEVDMLVEAGRMNKTISLQTKIWTSASTAQVDHWRRYTYASFLLGTHGQSYLNFNPEGPGRPPAAHAWEQVSIGAPTESYAKRGGVYQRRYTGGIAMVNPTDSPVRVTLDKAYQRLNGTTVTSFTLGANDGEILTDPSAPSGGGIPGATTTTTKPPGGTTTTKPPAPHVGTFTDDDGSVFEGDIEWIAAKGYTMGCNPPDNDRYCPDALVTRGQMAAFLNRALDIKNRLVGRFSDDNGSVYENDIEKIAYRGITQGCNPPANSRFCPDSVVTRGQMAAFLNRALGIVNQKDKAFWDDDGSVYEEDIEHIAYRGITLGCNPPTNSKFCPNAPVTRGQMAAFLHRAFG